MKSKILILFLITLTTPLFFFTDCDKDDLSSIKTGQWEGDDIAFSVTADPIAVNVVQPVITGWVNGTKCQFSYENKSAIPAYMKVDQQKFTFSSSTYNIEGKFTSNTSAELAISWSLYFSDCDGLLTGSKIYYAQWVEEEITKEEEKITDISGSWNIDLEITLADGTSTGTVSATMNLGQADSVFTGNLGIPGEVEAQIEGTVRKDVILFSMIQTVPCAGSFNGNGSIQQSGSKLVGSYSGSDCSGSIQTNFTAIKK